MLFEAVAAKTATLCRHAIRVFRPPRLFFGTLLNLINLRLAIKTVKTPYMADSITQGTLSSWEKRAGDTVAKDALVASIETDKVTIPVNSPYEGKLVECLAKEGETVNVGSDLFRIDEMAIANAKDAGKTLGKSGEPVKPEDSAKSETAVKSKRYTLVPPPAPSPVPQPQSSDKQTVVQQSGSAERGEYREGMSRMRLKIAERMKYAQNTAASLTTFNEIDMHSLVTARNEYKEEFQRKHGVKLGLMSPFMLAATKALQELPILNATVDMEGQQIVYHRHVDISVAVATPKGLVTPVVRDCQTLSLSSMERILAELGEKARAGKIGIDELTGGTFTISNGGIFGSMMGTPILNPPQVAILGMHAIKERPLVVNGSVVARPHMYVALTYDHRVVDGREAATFLVRIKQMIEDPHRFPLDL